MEDKPPRKRTWHYLYEPAFYECHCMVDGKVNEDHKVTWSEWEGMLWCYDCAKDMKGFGGIFDGPIIFEAAKMIMGETCFHRWNMKRKCVEAPFMGKNNMYYKKDPAMTAKFLAIQKKEGV